MRYPKCLGGRFLLNMDKVGMGWSLASDAGRVTANAAHPCPLPPESDFPFGPLGTLMTIWGAGPKTIMQI